MVLILICCSIKKVTYRYRRVDLTKHKIGELEISVRVNEIKKKKQKKCKRNCPTTAVQVYTTSGYPTEIVESLIPIMINNTFISTVISIPNINQFHHFIQAYHILVISYISQRKYPKTTGPTVANLPQVNTQKLRPSTDLKYLHFSFRL